MPSMRLERVCAAVMLLLFTPCLARGDDWKQRLLDEGPRAWATLDEMSRHLRGSFVYKQSYQGVKKPSTEELRRFAINGDRIKVETTFRGKDQVDATNPEYMFSLSRKVGAASFAIDYVEPFSGHDNLVHAAIDKMQTSIFNDIRAAWYLNARSLSDWLTRPGFQIDDVAPLARGNETLVEVKYTYKDPGPDRKQDFIGGRFVLDPNRQWTIREFQTPMSWGGTVKANLIYGGDLEGFPLVTERTTLLEGNDKTSLKRELQFKKLTRETVPEAEFQMAGFGLPEPKFAPAPTNMTPYWYLLIAVTLAVAAIVLGRQFRRASPAPGF